VRQAIAKAAETSENAEMFLTRIVRSMASDLEKSDYKEGCPIATTALETAPNQRCWAPRPAARSRNGSFEINAGCSASAYPRATPIWPRPRCSAARSALLLARTYRSLEPLRRAEQAVKLLVRGRAGE